MEHQISLAVLSAGPAGITPEVLQTRFSKVSRSTLNRRLAELCTAGTIKSMGAGRSTRYVSTSPFTRADIDAYFALPANTRPVAPFQAELLEPTTNIDPDRAARCLHIQALAFPMDRKYLAEFLVDFSWGSSLLEGSTYSALDTAALVKYGQQNRSKPTEDAVLALNHKLAGEYLWAHRDLSLENICAMHGMLTDNHGVIDEADSDHFLPAEQRGRPRIYEDVRLQNSAYMPPFRPGTGHAAEVLTKIVDVAKALDPVEAALYLMTRIAYVQSFANGNKRTSRIAANIPLLAGGHIPFSFVDVDKADYIRGMAAFYELGSMHVIEQTFIQGYVKSIVRSSKIPDSMRVAGFNVDAICDLLVGFVNTGRMPADPRARVFLWNGP